MTQITKPIILNETGQRIAAALEGLGSRDTAATLAAKAAAASAAEAAQKLEDVETAMAALPDGEAVSAQVALNTTAIADIKSGAEVVGIAQNLETWQASTTLQPYTHTAVADSAGGSMSIRSDVQAKLLSIAPTSERAKATKLVATGVNLLRLTSQTGGLAVAVGAGWYFPCCALTQGTYGTADENNGLVFTNASNAFLTPTVYMKRIADGVPTSVTDGLAARTWTGQQGETFYVNPAAYAGEACYVIVSGITQASSCAHLAWSGVGTPYNYYVSPTAAADAGIEAALTAAITAIGNNGYLTLCGQKADTLEYESDTLLRWTKRNGRVQPMWTTEEDADNAGTYTHTATIAAMLSDGAAMLETSGTALTVNGQTVTYTDQTETATTEYVVYNLAAETTGTVSATMLATVNDFGLIVLLEAEGTMNLTIAYAQGINDALRALMMGGYSDANAVIAQALNQLATNLRNLRNTLTGNNSQRMSVKLWSCDVMELMEMGTPRTLISSTAGAPSASVIPDNWDEDTMGVWNGCPRFIGQEYIDKKSKKLYKALTLTNSTSDWVVMN